MLRVSFLLTTMLAVSVLAGQVITMINPGFEDQPRHSQTPRSWINCGSPGESPPDILPEMTFQVNLPAYEGNTYVGLVTRDNNTRESVCTYLTEVLVKDLCYQFSLAIAKSDSYYSVSKSKNIPANYVHPTRLKIWGGGEQCEMEELLAESPIINHKNWQVYTFIIKPEVASYSVITLEVCYPQDDPAFFTNGNILLDDASAFVMLPDCGKDAYGVDHSTSTTKTVIITQTQAPSLMEDNTIYLKLPPESYFEGTEPLKVFLSNVFLDIEHAASGALIEKYYQIEGETTIRRGYPAVHALAYALNAYPEKAWELVVFDQNEKRQQQRVTSLKTSMNDWLSSYIFDCQVRGYDARLDDGTEWFCMSVANGLYLVEHE